MQDGLTTSVSMFVKSACIILGTMAILFTYNAWVALIVIGIIIPQFLVTRISAKYLDNFAVTYQKAKGVMSNIATESLSNVRTVKCFADEEMTSVKFAIQSQKVFEYGRARGYFWAIYFIGSKFLGSGGDLAMIYILVKTMGYF